MEASEFQVDDRSIFLKTPNIIEDITMTVARKYSML
jgi:hypothetical protein